MSSKIKLALLAGSANVLAFAPYHLWPLQILSLALMFYLSTAQISASNPPITKRALFALGCSYSFAWLFCGVSWLLVAMVRYGDMPIWLAVPALAILAGYLCLYSGLALVCGVWFQRRWKVSGSLALLFVFPAFWALSEWVRGWVGTGFPWLASGYAHTESPLAGFAPLIGVYGIGWVSAVVAGLISILLQHRQYQKYWKQSACALLAIFFSGQILKQVDWTQEFGKPISVNLLQGNVAQDIKFNSDHVHDSLLLYRDMIAASPADLIATPETALPVLSSQLPKDYLPYINQIAQQTDSHIIIGLGIDDSASSYANSVLGFSRQHAAQAYRYDKHHLVPFGEFVPAGFHWFVRLLNIPLGDFHSAGLQQAPMQVRDQWVMPNICYEDLFGEEIAAQLAGQQKTGRQSATILLNTSNIAWYGDSIAIPQHLQISQMRAMELGRPMLRATNTGSTAVINSHGVVLSMLQPITRGVLHATVQGRSGLTIYTQMGNLLIGFLIAISLLLAALMRMRKRA